MSQITQGYQIDTKVTGVPVAVKPYNENAKKKGAQLQFATITPKGLETIDVKIEASREADLQKFVNQNVVIKNVEINKIDFNTFYSCPDKSLVAIDNKTKGA